MSAIIEIRGASRWYGDVIGINDVTLDVGTGITGLLGPNGAGKSTLLRLITGQLKPSQGTVQVFGEPNWNRPHLLPMSAGTHLGPDEILGPIGAGAYHAFRHGRRPEIWASRSCKPVPACLVLPPYIHIRIRRQPALEPRRLLVLGVPDKGLFHTRTDSDVGDRGEASLVVRGRSRLPPDECVVRAHGGGAGRRNRRAPR